MQRLPLARTALLCLLGATAGCASGQPFRLFTPGTVQQKRIRATVHDPYPDQDAGPEVVGGRPREYQQPLAEPVRNRFFADSWMGW